MPQLAAKVLIMQSGNNALAFDLTQQFLDAYEANDDGQKLEALKARLHLQGSSVLAGLLEWFAEHTK
jgi:hypothetical protein